MRVRWAVALVLMAVAMMAVGAGCGSGSGEGSAEGLPASPAGKLEAVNFDGIRRSEIEVTLKINRLKKKPEAVKMRILGNFVNTGEEPLPQLDVAIESHGELAGRKIEFLSGPLLRAQRWIINFGGKVYEPDHATVEELKSKFEEAQGEEGASGNAMACVEAATGFKPADFVNHVSYEGKGEAFDGTEVQTVGADLDVSAVIDELIKLIEASPGCKAQMEAIGLPPKADLQELQRELNGSLTAARLTLGLDTHGMFRALKILANLELPHSQELEIEFTMALRRVNGIELPDARGYSPFPSLLKQFGLDEEDVKQADAGEIYVGVLGMLADRLFGREQG